MILDYQNIGELERAFQGGTVFLDGVEINQVVYLDTKAGIVQTYDLSSHPDLMSGPLVRFPRLGLMWLGLMWKEIFRDGKLPEDVDAPIDDVMRWTRKGKIELLYPDGRRFED